MTFVDRTDAGQRLAAEVMTRGYVDPVVLALPRGGVPVAAPIAGALHAPLDLVLVRKIGVPGQPEVAAGAVVNGDDPHIVVNPKVLAVTGMSEQQVHQLAQRELNEIRRRRAEYLAGRPSVEVRGRTAIVVDDGIATGATVQAALRAVAGGAPARVVLAVPVAARDILAVLQAEVDEVVCLLAPRRFHAVGEFYRDFHQVSDAELRTVLDKVE